jgi:hypothetical protein
VRSAGLVAALELSVAPALALEHIDCWESDSASPDSWDQAITAGDVISAWHAEKIIAAQRVRLRWM